MIAEEAAQLARRLLQHEEQAFLDFQRVYRRLFLAVFRGMGLSPVNAEDLAATAITDICLMLEKWDPEAGNFDGWVRTIARNLGLQWLRTAKASPMVPLIDGFDAAVEVLERGCPVQEGAVRDALAQLSPSERVLIDMRGLETESEVPYAEISDFLARMTGEVISVPALRVRYSRAKDKLRKILHEDQRIQFREPKTLGEKDEQDNESAEPAAIRHG